MDRIMEDVVSIDFLDLSRRFEIPFLVPQSELIEYFSRVRTKNEIVEGFLEFGSRCFSNLALFTVFSRSLQYLTGRGDNIRSNPHLGAFDIDLNTIVRRAVRGKFPYRGPIPIGLDEKVIFDRYFNSYAEEVFLYPGCIRGAETDVLFYADTPVMNRERSVVTFEYVLEKTVIALKLLWFQRQLATV